MRRFGFFAPVRGGTALLVLTVGAPALFATACDENAPPDWCLDRQGDADCDGTPDTEDQCDGTPYNSLVDRRGCLESQVAGCSVSVVGATGPQLAASDGFFRWEGNCDVYLLQFSNDPDFPLTETITAVRTEGLEVQSATRGEWWRVVGGLRGSASGAATEPRRIAGEP